MDNTRFNLNNWNEAEIILALSMQKIYDAFCQNRGLQYLVDQTRNLLKRPLIIYDTSNKILVASHDAGSIFHLSNKDDGSHYISEDTVSWIQSNRLTNTDFENQNSEISCNHFQRTLCTSIKIDTIKIGEIAVFESDIPFMDMDFQIIKKVALLLSAQLQKNILLNLDHNQLPNNILVDLIEGRSINSLILSSKEQHLKWARSEFMYIVIITNHQYQTFESIKSTTFQALKSYIPISQFLIYESSIVAFMDEYLHEQLFNKNKENFSQFLTENNLYAGVSQKYSDLSKSKQQYQNAITALKIGRLKNSRCTFFDDCTLHILADLISSRYDLADFCHPAVVMLSKYDEDHDTNYLNTLKQYIYYASSPSEAASVLNIHKNTLFYRIGKIKELTGITLGYGDEISKIFFSIQLLELKMSLSLT